MNELSVAFANFINDINGPFWTLMWVVGSFVALVWIISLASKMRKSTVPGAQSISGGEILGVVILSALLANFAGTLNIVSHSFGFGDASFGPISYVQSGGQLGQFAVVINAALTFAAMMGGLFGFKGLYLLHAKVKGENRGGDLVLQGIIHLLGGGLLVRLSEVLSSLAVSIK